MANELQKVNAEKKQSLLAKFAERYSVDPAVLNSSLKSVAFKQREGVEITDAQMVALLIVADQYGLNPFTKQIYAYPDKNGGIVPVVGVDGWANIVLTKKDYKGLSFEYPGPEEWTTIDGKTCPMWIKCSISRNDKDTLSITEYLDECYKPAFEKAGKDGKGYKIAGPWQTHPKRMLRHKAMIQCARLAYGLSGIYDEDEARTIVETSYSVEDTKKKTMVAMPKLKDPGFPVLVQSKESDILKDKPDILKDKPDILNESQQDYVKGLDDDNK